VYVSVTRHPNSLNLLLIIGLAALGLLLLLLCIALTICLSAVARRRRRAKASDDVDFQTTPSSSTVSVNLSPSSSSCSRTSEGSIDSDAEAPPAPELPPLPPALPTVFDPPRPVVGAPAQEDSDIPAVVIRPDTVMGGVGTGVGVGSGKPSWTQSMPSVVVGGVLSAHDVRRVPPMIAKKTAKAQATAARPPQPSGPSSEDPVNISVTMTSADPLPGLGPERPKPAGPRGRYVHIPPKLHREPRGWAPASHAVPAPVKRTWGRAKAKLAAERELNASVTASSSSLTECDENDVASSTLSLM